VLTVAPAKQIRIPSVEDHPVFRHGLATSIETEPDMVLAGQAVNGVEAIAQFPRHRPDLTLMDLRLPGADILATIRGEFPDARINLFRFRHRYYSGSSRSRRVSHGARQLVKAHKIPFQC
jgi:chemotaxis response regulator CheB